MNIDIEKIKNLNSVSVATQEANLGDLLLYIISSLDDKKEEIATESKDIKIDFVPDTEAISIKQLVADYNKLLSVMRKAGIMAEE